MVKGDVNTYYEDGEWKNKIEGNGRASSKHETKSDVQAAGREAAIERGVEHTIRKMDGTIGEKNTYPRGRDKNPPKG